MTLPWQVNDSFILRLNCAAHWFILPVILCLSVKHFVLWFYMSKTIYLEASCDLMLRYIQYTVSHVASLSFLTPIITLPVSLQNLKQFDRPFSLVIQLMCGWQPSIWAWLPPAGKCLFLRGPAAKQDWFPWWRRAWQRQKNIHQLKKKSSLYNLSFLYVCEFLSTFRYKKYLPKLINYTKSSRITQQSKYTDAEVILELCFSTIF